MDERDRRIVNALQTGFPVQPRPYMAAATALGMTEAEIIARLRRLLDDRTLTRFGPMYDAEAMGGAFCLCAMQVPAERFDEVTAAVNAMPEVAHNYERTHRFNMWFVLATERPEQVAEAIDRIERATGLEVLSLPKEAEYFIGLRLAG